MHNQVQALILSIAKASEKGLVAYEIQQDKITAHLYTIAEMVNRLDRIDMHNRYQLSEIFQENGLAYLLIYSSGGRADHAFSLKSVSPDPGEINKLKSEIEARKDQRQPLQFISGSDNGRGSFAIGIERFRGGAIVVGIDAGELLTLRKTFGAGSVIDDISQSPGVKYAGIFRSGQLVVASRNFHANPDDDWYLSDSLAAGEIRTRTTRTAGNDGTFEAIAPFKVAGDLFGNIVIGIDGSYLDLLTAKLRRDILWRSILFLIVAIVTLAGLILRQNYRLLTGQYAEIQSDVHRLEADKALSAKLVAMGELAGGVAHEIRNPLNAISVIIQRLEREFKPQSDEAEYKELTAIIRKETDKINDSVKNFLTLARPPVLHKSRSDLNGNIKGVVMLFQPQVEKRGCSIKTEFGDLPSRGI